MIKAGIFDRDGTLVDSEWVNIDAGTEAFKRLGVTITNQDKLQILGRAPVDYLPYFVKKYSFDVEEFNRIVPIIYYDLFDKSQIFEDTIQLVKDLGSYDLLRALNTWWYQEGNDRLFKRVWLENTFDVVVTRDMYDKSKPDPESYLIAIEKLWLQAHECVAIEDAERWLASAKAAGAKCIVIPNEYTKNQDFSQADLIVKSARELTIEIIKGL